jgi:hypothetical protein
MYGIGRHHDGRHGTTVDERKDQRLCLVIVVQMARHEDSSKLYNLKGPSLGCNLRLKVVAVVDFPKRQATLGTTLS